MVYLLTPAQMLRRGLRLIQHTDRIQQRRYEKTNVKNFKSAFGKHPIHLCRIWRDLQQTNIPEAFLPEDEARSKNGLRGFLLAFNLLKVYSSHSVRASLFSAMDVNLCAELTWTFVGRIASLITEKVVWPQHWDEHFAASVDGTQCPTNEPREPNMRKNPVGYPQYGTVTTDRRLVVGYGTVVY